jgi:hypothetical protein
MKYTLLILLCLLSCKTPEFIYPDRQKDLDASWVYKVIRIDSINSWNLIYVQRGKCRYKIISAKDIVGSGTKIRKNRSYNFKLHSHIYGAMVASGVSCFAYDTATSICFEFNKGIYDLLYSDNIRGLYLIKSDSSAIKRQMHL